MKIFITFFIALNFVISTQAQNEVPINTKTVSKKGSFYIAWGWNRAKYTNSDIQFKGANYDFKLKKIAATDDPTGFKPGIHLNPMKLTIPQTNFRLGYYINDNYSVCFGFDHMKYVMNQYQQVKISGTIKNSGTEYDGNYNNDNFEITPDFLMYENTDGLNYIHFELNRHDILVKANNKRGNEIFALLLTEGASVGGMFPRTDAHVLNLNRNNDYHVTGYGTGIKGAISLQFFRHFFIQGELKTGYINMTNIKATEFQSDNARQHFFYYQSNILIGGIFNILGKKA